MAKVSRQPLFISGIEPRIIVKDGAADVDGHEDEEQRPSQFTLLFVKSSPYDHLKILLLRLLELSQLENPSPYSVPSNGRKESPH